MLIREKRTAMTAGPELGGARLAQPVLRLAVVLASRFAWSTNCWTTLSHGASSGPPLVDSQSLYSPCGTRPVPTEASDPWPQGEGHAVGSGRAHR